MKSKSTKSTKNGISPNQLHPQFGISNEITKFPVNLQNSALEISASLIMNGTQKKIICASFQKWNLKNLTEFFFGNCNFNFKLQSYNCEV